MAHTHTLYGKKHCLQSMELCVMLCNVWIARIAHMIEFNDGVKIVVIRILVDKDNILLRTRSRYEKFLNLVCYEMHQNLTCVRYSSMKSKIYCFCL